MNPTRLLRAVGARSILLFLSACGGASLMQALPQPSTLSPSQAFTLPGDPPLSDFTGINDRGDIVANGRDGSATSAYVAHAPYRQENFERIRVPGSLATTVTAVNNGGTIVGFYTGGNGRVAAFSRKNGVWSRDSGPRESTRVEYLGVNDSGAVVGFSTDPFGANHAFERSSNGSYRWLRPSGAVGAIATAANAAGDVVGYFTTRSHGDVRGFLAKQGKIAEFVYPGAEKTKPLGIANDGRIVGSYDDSSGATHGFIVRDVMVNPRWNRYDEPNAFRLTALTGINAGGQIVGYYADAHSRVRGLLSHGINQGTSKVPLVIPVWGYGADLTDTDPGAVPDQHLFAAILDNSEDSNQSLAKNCPGVSSSSTCQPYKYSDFFYLHCVTTNSLAAYRWANGNDENAFLHNYPSGPTWSNRVTYQATPNVTCQPNSQNAVMRMNPGDSGYNAWLYKNVWNGSNYQNDFPSPYGVMEDQASIPAWLYVGGSSVVTTEYGSGTRPSGFANQVGNSRYHAATDFETAIGIFVNGACGAKCVSVAINGPASGAGNIGSCNVISNGHCHGQADSGDVDNQAAIDNICKEATHGNLTAFLAERPVFMGRFGKGFLNGQSMTFDINTSANLYSHTSDGCAHTKLVDLEPSWGLGGLGDVLGGHRVRLVTLAYRWMVANPSTGIPDRVISQMFSIGGTRQEVPYFFEDTMVPYGAETRVPKFVWNGKVQTTGGGCPSASGDTGGAVSLLVQCIGSDGIYCQQYPHLYINGTDYGNVAACLNTTANTANIKSSWFKHDPISSYKYVLALKGGEMTSVPYQGVPGGSIALPTCTNKVLCTGSNQLSAQVAPFKGDGTDQLCGQCAAILLRNE